MKYRWIQTTLVGGALLLKGGVVPCLGESQWSNARVPGSWKIQGRQYSDVKNGEMRTVELTLPSLEQEGPIGLGLRDKVDPPLQYWCVGHDPQRPECAVFSLPPAGGAVCGTLTGTSLCDMDCLAPLELPPDGCQWMGGPYATVLIDFFIQGCGIYGGDRLEIYSYVDPICMNPEILEPFDDKKTLNTLSLIVPPPKGGGTMRWTATVCAGKESVSCVDYWEVCPDLQWWVQAWTLTREGIIGDDCLKRINAPMGPQDCECEELAGVVTGSPSIYLPGPGPRMSFDFQYKSRMKTSGALGKGWSHAFDMVLRESPMVSIDASTYFWWTELENDGSGEDIWFGYWNDAGWYIPTGEWKSIDTYWDAGIDDLVYELTTKTGTVYRFEPHDDDVQYVHDIDFEIEWIEDTNGNRIEFVYDETSDAKDKLLLVKDVETGRSFNLVYDGGASDMSIDRVTFPQEGSSVQNREWIVTYDTEGRVSRIDKDEGQYEEYEYGDDGWVGYGGASGLLDLEWQKKDNMTRKEDAGGVATVYEYVPEEDMLSKTRSGTGKLESRREQTEIFDGEEVEAYETTISEYLDDQEVFRTVYSRMQPSEPLSGSGTRADGNLQWVTREVKEEWLEGVVWNTRIREYDYGWDYEDYIANPGSPVEDTLPREWLTCAKDLRGRKTYYVYYHDDETEAKYGSLKQIKTPDDIVTSYTYNGYAQPLEVVVDEGTGPENYNLTTTYTYDASGNMLSLAVPVGDGETATTFYEYDSNGDLTKTKDPLWNAVEPNLVSVRE